MYLPRKEDSSRKAKSSQTADVCCSTTELHPYYTILPYPCHTNELHPDHTTFPQPCCTTELYSDHTILSHPCRTNKLHPDHTILLHPCRTNELHPDHTILTHPGTQLITTDAPHSPLAHPITLTTNTMMVMPEEDMFNNGTYDEPALTFYLQLDRTESFRTFRSEVFQWVGKLKASLPLKKQETLRDLHWSHVHWVYLQTTSGWSEWATPCFSSNGCQTSGCTCHPRITGLVHLGTELAKCCLVKKRW